MSLTDIMIAKMRIFEQKQNRNTIILCEFEALPMAQAVAREEFLGIIFEQQQISK